MRKYKNTTAGFTLIEMLIVVAIIGLLLVALMVSLRSQRQKAEDARVKSDLEKIKIAFEDYYNDNNCYPPETMFDAYDDCDSEALRPYLSSIPCDPRSEMPYPIEYVNGDQCKGYKLYGTLANASDPSSTKLCVASGGSTFGNYGVSSGNTSISVDCAVSAGGSSAPVPSHIPGAYACQNNICKNFGDGNSCAVNFAATDCEGYCSTQGAINCN